MKSLSECRLYTFMDTAYLQGRPPSLIAQQLCDGGSDLIQLRAKTSSPDEIRRLAAAILPIIEGAGASLVINDFPEIAREVGARICHLGQEDFFGKGHTHVAEVTSNLELQTPKPQRLQIGLSTHAPEEARRALAAQPDYIAIGPVFATKTKPAAKPVTLDYVRWAATHVQIPWFAIGGITLQNIEEVLAAGARRIGVVSAILNAPDIAKTCQQFTERLLSAA